MGCCTRTTFLTGIELFFIRPFGRGGLSAARYWASNARRADSTVSPKPAIPSRTFGPRSATQVPERRNKFGRRTAAGLPGHAAKYNSARSQAAANGEIAE